YCRPSRHQAGLSKSARDQFATFGSRRSIAKTLIRTGRQHNKMSPHLLSRNALRMTAALGIFSMLAACSSGPSSNISLIPAETAQQTSKQGLFTQAVKWEHSKPGCKGECPSIKVDSLVFPGIPRLTELVDHALAMMTGVSSNGAPPYATIAEYEQYFWQTAAP